MSVDIDDAAVDDTTPVENEGLEDESGPVAAEQLESQQKKGRSWRRIAAFGILPALALLLAVGAGYLKFQDNSVRQSQTAASESVRAATEDTVALLSYHPDSVDKELNAARDRLTGDFSDAYSRLIDDVVIPGAKQQRISAVATVPAAASVSATEKHAVVLVFVNQTTTIGDQPPTSTTSSVRVTLDKVQDRWLVSKFEPV